jgi:hypothetical protein
VLVHQTHKKLGDSETFVVHKWSLEVVYGYRMSTLIMCIIKFGAYLPPDVHLDVGRPSGPMDLLVLLSSVHEWTPFRSHALILILYCALCFRLCIPQYHLSVAPRAVTYKPTCLLSR